MTRHLLTHGRLSIVRTVLRGAVRQSSAAGRLVGLPVGLLLFGLSSRGLAAAPPAFEPGAVWLDTSGQPIQAHGGGILHRNGTYYWYGEDKSQGYFNTVGVSGYSSRDLHHWKHLGVVLPKTALPADFQDQGVCERPKVIYNPHTRQYVMWMHLDAHGYSISEAGVAVAKRPAGPFRFVRAFRPIPESTFRDMNLFVDDDGAAYVFFTGDNNASVYAVKLSGDFLDVVRPMVEGQTWAKVLRMSREGPAPFKYGGHYYLITSACTGWRPNAASYAVADQILGPWTVKGNPSVGPDANTTFHSQSTYVLPAPGNHPGSFIFMADRWEPRSLSDSRYIWLPFTVAPDGACQIEWRDRWSAPGG